MPRFRTEETRLAYHLYRQQVTETQRREREERRRARVVLCEGCHRRIDFLQIPVYDKDLGEITSRAIPVLYGTTETHFCPEYRRLKAELLAS